MLEVVKRFAGRFGMIDVDGIVEAIVFARGEMIEGKGSQPLWGGPHASDKDFEDFEEFCRRGHIKVDCILGTRWVSRSEGTRFLGSQAFKDYVLRCEWESDEDEGLIRKRVRDFSPIGQISK